MKINHKYAVELEFIARKVHGCERFAMGGLINSDHFERHPFDAALIALVPLWKSIESIRLEEFFCKWESTLHCDEECEDEIIVEYIQELQELVDSMMD